MEHKRRTFFRSSDARGFLFFLLLTSVVAVLIKLSKEYTKMYTVPIEITNIPLDKTVNEIRPEEVIFKAQLSGFSLLMNSLRRQELKIDFSSLDSISSNTFTFNTAGSTEILSKAVPGAQNFSAFKTSSITVAVDKMASKRVPVIADVIIDYESGFDSYKAAAMEPDSVTIVGPLGVLEEINTIKTKRQRAQAITNTVRLTLEPDTLAI